MKKFVVRVAESVFVVLATIVFLPLIILDRLADGFIDDMWWLLKQIWRD